MSNQGVLNNNLLQGPFYPANRHYHVLFVNCEKIIEGIFYKYI